jgi:hypothetical protein
VVSPRSCNAIRRRCPSSSTCRDEATRNVLLRERQRASIAAAPKRFFRTFVAMLHEAIDRGRLSARKAAKALGGEPVRAQ